MPQSKASSSRPNSKASTGRQTASPRRSARLQQAPLAGVPQNDIDRSEKIKPAESPPLDPTTGKGAGQKRKRHGEVQQTLESDPTSPKVQGADCKRKRSEEAEQPVQHSLPPAQFSFPIQSQEREEQEAAERATTSHFAQQPEEESRRSLPEDEELPQSYFAGTCHDRGYPVDHWVKYNVWPSNYAESGESPNYAAESWELDTEEMANLRRTPSMKRQAKERLSKETWDIDIPRADVNNLNASETRARLLKEEAVIKYLQNKCEEPAGGLTDSAKETCRRVLESSQTAPSHTEEYIDRLFRRSQWKNETKVVQDIGPLVAPRVEPFYYDGDNDLEKMTESVDEAWSSCVPLLGYNYPTPDYAAGFHYDIAFTEKQRSVLERFSNSNGCSLFKVTMNLSFPFLNFEAKGADGLETDADLQSTEVALIATRGVIELFKRANLAKEIHLEIIAFSMTFNGKGVRLFGHLADISGEHPKFYRHLINGYTIPQVGSSSYNMVKYIYKVWAQDHWKRICRAIDVLSAMPGFARSTASLTSFSVSGNRTPQSGSIPPPPPRPSSSSNIHPQRDLTPTTSPNRDNKKPKISD